ncbi:MAG TPA: response regulator [Aggregatilineales bacterium]|nr:response regulator [Anaerolineae bacterium]HUN09131.1 response regulator [Aggregatilineales bacterium]
MSPTVLLIEDETSLLEEVTEWLELEGYQVISTSSGEDGIQKARQHQPDVIVCDIVMPHLDGFSVLAALRQHPVTVFIPLIFLTARAMRSDKEMGLAAGAFAYITKPFGQSEFLDILQQSLNKRSGA